MTAAGRNMRKNAPIAASLPPPTDAIESHIYSIRGHRVMRDTDLARLYGVQTFNLNKSVRRNIQRFPEDFMFQVNEVENLTFQIGMSSSSGYGGRRTLPYVFTGQGVAMLSTVLHSERAIKVNIAIMRTFVSLRAAAFAQKDHTARIDALERHFEEHDVTIKQIFEAIRTLMKSDSTGRRIGFIGRKSE